jgi:hypothetical protein
LRPLFLRLFLPRKNQKRQKGKEDNGSFAKNLISLRLPGQIS